MATLLLFFYSLSSTGIEFMSLHMQGKCSTSGLGLSAAFQSLSVVSLSSPASLEHMVFLPQTSKKIAVIRGAYHQTALVYSTKYSYKNVSPSSRSKSRIWGYNMAHLGVLDFGAKQILSSG